MHRPHVVWGLPERPKRFSLQVSSAGLLAGDGQQPRADGGLLPEARRDGVGPEEDLLRDLLPVPGIPQQGGAVAHDQVLVRSDEHPQHPALLALRDQALHPVITGLGGAPLRARSPRT
jgi:hypothetical protein